MRQGSGDEMFYQCTYAERFILYAFFILPILVRGDCTVKKLVLAAFLYWAVLYSVGYAHTIGFACLYNADAPAGSAELTTMLETELFEFCFDHGIVTTSIEHLVGKIEQYEDNALLVKQFDSSIDFLVALYCEYKHGHRDETRGQYAAVDWRCLKWKIIDFSTRTTVFEQLLDVKKVSETDLVRKLKTIGASVGDGLLNTL